jgi:NitT/TauT family transport system substrate-binding protein
MKIRGQTCIRWLIGTIVLALITFTMPTAGGAQSLKKIVIGYSGISPSQAPAWVAHDQGFFRKYGLDVQLIFIEGGSRTVQTLVSGDVIAAQVAGSSVLQSNLKGSGVVLIGGFLNTMDYKFVVAHDITRPDQLRGKAVAVSRIGSSSDFATRYALEKYGLTPDKDVTILQIGSQPARFSALEAGKIQGAMIAIPLTGKAAKLGLNILADLQMLGLEYQHTGLAVNENLIKSQPDLVRAILKAFVEAIHYMKTHRKETMAVLAKYLKTDDPDALEDSYDSVIQALIPKKPYPTLKGIQIMLREMAAKEPAARNARPQQFVDLTFIKELDKSGFIDQMYKTPVVAKAPPAPEPQPVPASPKVTKTAAPAARAETVAKEEPQIPAVTETPPAAEAPKPVETTVTPAKPAVTSAKAPASGPQQYTVKAGDTLSKLAEHFYNSIAKWETIYEANKDTLKNPNYIYIGQKLLIPPPDQPTES